MWKITSIRMKNFMSHPDTTYSISQNITTMIYGINVDDPGADSNGAGKSTIIKAITIALIGIPNRDLSQEDYIMDGEDSCELYLSMENPVLKKKIDICRVFYKTSSSEITITEDGIVNKKITSVDEGNGRIIELIDISKEDILNYFIINQENSHSFFRVGDTDKKKIISRFTNSVLVDKAIELIQKDLDVKRNEIQQEKNSVESINVRIETLNEQIVYENENKESESKEQLQTYSEEIKSLKEELIVTVDKQTSLLKIKIPELLNQIEELKLSIPDKKKLIDKLDKKRKDKNEKESELNEVKKLLRDLEKKVQGEIQCPKCNHKWSVVDPDTDIKDLKESLDDCEKLKEAFQIEIEQVEVEFNKVKDSINQIQSKNQRLDDLQENLDSLYEKTADLDSEIERKKELIKKYELKISEVKTFKKNKKRIEELEESINKENEKISVHIKNIETLEEEYNKIDFWRINMGIQGFKTYLVNSVLSSLEGYVNYNLNKFQTSLKVKINGFKVLKSQKVSEKIDVMVSKNGEDWKKFNRLSGGQKVRIEICGILALQKLINLSSKSGGIDLLALDEMFEGLDVSGQTSALKILEKSKVTTMVISHHNNDANWDNKLTIEYKQGKSKILNE